MQKKAEFPLQDANDFPRESFRERLARRYGIDSIALSGPCEGQPLVDCIVNQLEKRWEKIQQRFAGNRDKAIKLAMKMAETYMQSDDTQKCVKDLEKLGYAKTAADGIAGYLKAFAIGPADDLGTEELMEDIGGEKAPDPLGGTEEFIDDGEPAELPPPGGEELEGLEPGVEEVDDLGEMPPEVSPDVSPEASAETVTVEIPMDLAENIAQQVEEKKETPGEEVMEHGGDAAVMDISMEGEPEGEALGEPAIGEEPVGGEEPPFGEVEEIKDEVVPGEPDVGGEKQVVETEFADAGGAESTEQKQIGDLGGAVEELSQHTETPKGETKERDAIGKIEKILDELKGTESAEHAETPHGETKADDDKSGKPAADKPAPKKADDSKKADDDKSGKTDDDKTADDAKKGSSAKAVKTADDDDDDDDEEDEDEEEDGKKGKKGKKASGAKSTKTAAEMRKLGPEMAINNTDQLGGHDSKKLGTAKEKKVEEPKPIADGNLNTEGYSAGDKKFQDGKTMGREQAFDAKQLDKGATTGGDKSLMGKDESFPKGDASVPAGSAAIGGEQFEGGNVATKGTVIATISPDGIEVEGGGKKYKAKGAITASMVSFLEKGLAKIAYTGDAFKYANEAAALIRLAKTTKDKDGETKTDTSDLEAKNFTNDCEKKPEGEAAPKKGKAPSAEEGVKKTDTSKKEATEFTNDGEKKPEKDAATQKATKTAKPVEEPKPVSENVETDGYSAGDKKYQNNETMGREQKFDPKEVNKSDVSKGSSSTMGKFEEFPTGKADVPNGGGQMGNEPWKGDNLATKGTTIAETQSQKREASSDELQAKLNEAKVEKQRLMHASFYVADLLNNGEITEAEYLKELEKTAAMSVQQIQSLIASTKKARARVTAAVVASGGRIEPKEAGLAVPVVIPSERREQSLKDKIISTMKLTRDLDRFEAMPDRK